MKRNTYPILTLLGSIGISASWLLPNHYPPWAAFHADAWMAVSLIPILLISVLLTPQRIQWPAFSLFGLVIAVLVWFQFSAGLLLFTQQAWLSSAYLIGFSVAVVAGYRWEKYRPGALPDILFLAFAIASLLSVWLQWNTWLQLLDNEVTDIWSMGLSGNRPYANLGQPNNLATLLLWGILACFWAFNTRHIRGSVALLVACFFLTGLALTQSRSGLLSATVLLAAVWWWRRLWTSPRVPWAASALYVWLWTLPFPMKWLYTALALGEEAIFQRLVQQGELRLGAWKLFLYAAVERPWFGYGLTEVENAQLLVAEKLPGLGVTFGHTHNLFLDFVIWLGIPFGLFLTGWIIRWAWRSVLAVNQANQAIIFLTIAVSGVHAMVEFPLHYAYFLLPIGLMIGVLTSYQPQQVTQNTPRWVFATLATVTIGLMGTIISDYFKVESSYNAWRFETARIGIDKTPIGKPPEVLVLTHLREWISLARLDMTEPLDPTEMEWMRRVTEVKPSANGLYRLATAFARNGQPQEAMKVLPKICKICDPQECQLLQRAWRLEIERSKLPPALNWPSEEAERGTDSGEIRGNKGQANKQK